MGKEKLVFLIAKKLKTASKVAVNVQLSQWREVSIHAS